MSSSTPNHNRQENNADKIISRDTRGSKAKKQQFSSDSGKNSESAVFDDSGNEAILLLRAKILMLTAQRENYEQNTLLRKKYSARIFWLIVGYLIVVALLFVFTAVIPPPYRMRDDIWMSTGVWITILTTTTATILGLFAIVTKYLFNDKN